MMRQVVSLAFLLPLLVGANAQSDSTSTCKSARVEPDYLESRVGMWRPESVHEGMS